MILPAFVAMYQLPGWSLFERHWAHLTEMAAQAKYCCSLD